jgi:predicted PurR-regulated permease PerM
MSDTERSARIIIAVLAAAVLYALLPFLSGFVGAAVLAIAVRPAYERLSRRLDRRVAAVIVTTCTMLLVLVPGGAIVMSLLAQAPDVTRSVAQSPLLQNLAALRIAGIDIGASADSAVGAVITWVSGQAMTLVGHITLATLNAVVALFCLYYLLIAQDTAWRPVRRALPFSSSTIDLLATRFRTTTESMVIGIILTALAQGTVVGFAFAVVGLPNAAFWGFVTACTSVLPILGSAFVWLPGALVLAADHRYGAAIALGAIGLIVASQIDNVIRLFVYRRVSRIHPLVTLVGAFAGVRMFGLAGLLLGPLAISLLLELLQVYNTDSARRTTIESAAAD